MRSGFNQKKAGGGRWLRKISAGICLMISLMVSGMLLGQMMMVSSGRASAQTAVNLGAVDRFRMHVNNRLSDAMEGIASVEKVYWISGGSSSAPEPDPERYGSSEDPQTLGWLETEAQSLLDGQGLLFSVDTEIMPGSQVCYYLDDSILAITWKEVHNHTVYTYGEVKILHPSQFRRFLAGDAFGSGTLSLTTEMAQSVHAVLAGNGDYYAYRHAGVTVLDGVVYRSNPGIPEVCHVTRDGDLLMEASLGYRSVEDTQKFVDENRISFTLAFGPILVHEGELWQPWGGYPVGEVTENYTRAAICQLGKLHYVFIAANTEGNYAHTPDIFEFGRVVAETGCTEAYTLDGGQTATVVMNNRLVNCVNYGSQRRISDIIYFATAVPREG